MNSLTHHNSEKFILKLKKLGIPIYSSIIDKNVPPLNKRQWDNLVNKLVDKLFTLMKSSNQAFLLLGFQLNITKTIHQDWGPSGDKHAVVISLHKEGTNNYLEFFDINGKLNKSGYYRFDTLIIELLDKILKKIKNNSEFSNCYQREINPFKLNFGQGHCDLYSLYFIYQRYNKSRDNLVKLFYQINLMKLQEKKIFTNKINDKLNNL